MAAVDAPSIYDIPKVLHAEGLDAYVVRRLGLPFRDVDWTVWGDLLDRVHHPRTRRHGRAGRQVHRPARRLPVGHRGAARRRVRAPRQGRRSAGCRPTRARPRPARRPQLAGVDGVRDPGRVRRPRHRGQARRAAATPASSGIPTLGLCLGLQCMVIEAARHLAGIADANSAEFDAETRRPGDRHDGRPGRRSSPATATSAAPCASAPTRPTLDAGLGRGRGLRRDRGVRAAPAPLRGQQRLPRAAGEAAGLVVLRHLARRPPGRVRRAAARTCTRSSSAPRRTRSSSRARPGRTRCSRAFIGAALDYIAAERLPVEIPDERGGRLSMTRARTSDVSSTSVSHTGHLPGQGRRAARGRGRGCPAARVARREVVEHHGAVAVAALDERRTGWC